MSQHISGSVQYDVLSCHAFYLMFSVRLIYGAVLKQENQRVQILSADNDLQDTCFTYVASHLHPSANMKYDTGTHACTHPLHPALRACSHADLLLPSAAVPQYYSILLAALGCSHATRVSAAWSQTNSSPQTTHADKRNTSSRKILRFVRSSLTQ